MLRAWAKRALPDSILARLRSWQERREQRRRERLPALTEGRFCLLLTEVLLVQPGDIVFVHSSWDRLVAAFPWARTLQLLRAAVGSTGTLVFPTYPAGASYDFLVRGCIFDVRRTPSNMGLLSELARRSPQAVRSLHPTKSVCAIGPAAHELTAHHQDSPYPYDTSSPYGRVVALGGKVIGLGVTTTNLSLLHCADDALGDSFPVWPYHPRPLPGRCVDREGREVTVPTFAHDLRVRQRSLPKWLGRNVAPEVCRDLRFEGRPVFRADAAALFARLCELARQGQTIYESRFRRRRSAA
jgi:hypothetical protein